MKLTVLSLGLVAPVLLGLCGCDDYLGPGPDPAAAGPFKGVLPASGGTANNGGNGTGANGTGGDNCRPPDTCDPFDDGGVGMVIASNLGNNVNDLVLDDEFVYFTTNQGLAKVSKKGGAAVPLGGFANVSGVAVAGGLIYIVQDSGAVSTLKTDGSNVRTIVPSTMGGGSGPILLDPTQMFYTVGPYLRRAPREGGTASQLTNDVYQGGFAPNRLTVDDNFAYYVASAMGGGQAQQLRKIAKDAPSRMDQPGMSAGTLIVAAEGLIPALVSDGTSVYYFDVTSDGLNPLAKIRKVAAGDKPPEVLATVMIDSNGGGSGGDLVTDGIDLFFAGPRGLFRLPVEGGNVATIDETAMTGAIAVDDTYLYWADLMANGRLRRLEK